MRAWFVALATTAVVTACGDDEGMLISVTAGESVAEPIVQLHFVIGVEDLESGLYMRDDTYDAEVWAHVADRDLTARPYKLLLLDEGPGPDPTSVVVAVLGLDGDGAEVAFAGMPAPQTFVRGKVLRHELVLEAASDGGDYFTTEIGCFSYGEIEIVAPNDLDCDGCDELTGAGCAGDCTDPAECVEAFGDAPCGEWQCNAGACEVFCPDCSDGDLDGYGEGDGCAGADCDDANDEIFASAVAECYSGQPGTTGVGTCRAGEIVCTDGVWGGCSGEVVPSGEACNGEDDDCDESIDEDLGTFTCGLGACATVVQACAGGVVGNCTPPPGTPEGTECDSIDNDCDGIVDEDCTPCVLVAPGGDDSLAAGDDNATPFATIQGAIDWADSDPARPRTVCLAAGDCPATFKFMGPVSMKSGVHVVGKYALNRTQCPGSTTIIETGTPDGVLFGDGVQERTVLDNVRLLRDDSPTTAGITVNAATDVVISDVEIIDAPTVTSSYGINLVNGAEALITRVAIYGGNGSAETIAIRSIASTPTIVGNCPSLGSDGKCTTWCGNALEPTRSIRGRYTKGTGVSHAVLLDSSPRAIVAQSGLCGVNSENGAVIRIKGNAEQTVIRGNLISAWNPSVQSDGILLEDCGGHAPWIVDNHEIWAEGELVTTRVAGIRALGDCHPVIDGNDYIVGGSEDGTTGATGVYCGAGASAVPSRCVILGNERIQGSHANNPPTATAVRCEDGGCMRIAGNEIVGHTGVDVYGLWLGETGALVDGNRIVGGCARSSATGVYAEGSYARLQNNRIFAGSCEGDESTASFVAIDVRADPAGNEIDVHSNFLDGSGASTACTSTGLSLGSTSTSPAAGSGIFRNNIIRAGICAGARYGVREADAGSDPRVFEHNDLDPHAAPTALYRDENLTDIQVATDIDALLDMIAGGNISVDPAFAGYPSNVHLTTGSMCIGAGTATGAPEHDMDGDARDPTAPDIGPDEHL